MKHPFLLLVIIIFLPALNSCISMSLPGKNHKGDIPELTQIQSKDMQIMKTHIEYISNEIGEHNYWKYGALEDCKKYIVNEGEKYGYKPVLQSYNCRGKTVSNIEFVKHSRQNPNEFYVIGAHYDSVHGTVGADDNTSSVAALLHLADYFKDKDLKTGIRFVFFVNEEPPFFHTEEMGSLIYAKQYNPKSPGNQFHKNPTIIKGMISLDPIGYYSTEKKSQRYPFPLSLFYPGTGDFIALVADNSSRKFLKQVGKSFRKHASIPSRGIAAPRSIPGITFSDHWSFSINNIPAMLFTNTGMFRNPHYHRTTDLPDTLDYHRMTLVVDGIKGVIKDLTQ